MLSQLSSYLIIPYFSDFETLGWPRSPSFFPLCLHALDPALWLWILPVSALLGYISDLLRLTFFGSSSALPSTSTSFLPHACHRWNVCVPLKCVCWNIIPKMMVFGGRASGKWLGHETRALVKKTSESSLIPLTVWGHREKVPSMNRSVVLSSWMSGLQNGEALMFYVYKPLSPWYSVRSAQMDSDASGGFCINVTWRAPCLCHPFILVQLSRGLTLPGGEVQWINFSFPLSGCLFIVKFAIPFPVALGFFAPSQFF